MSPKELEKPLKALANKRRLAILQYLKKEGEATVGDIAREIKLSLKATSKHLRMLSALDILESRQRSLEVYYCIAEIKIPIVRSVLSLL